MKIIPAGHRILVLPDKVDETTEGGLYKPDETRQREQLAIVTGVVVAVGPTAWKDMHDGKPWAEVGDRIVFQQYGGFVFTDTETHTQYRALNDDDVILILKDEEE